MLSGDPVSKVFLTQKAFLDHNVSVLVQVLEEREKLAHKPPVLVKIAPDLSSEDRKDIAAVITRQEVSKAKQGSLRGEG